MEVLKVTDISKNFGGVAAVDRLLDDPAGERDHGDHRPQRRGQDDGLQPHHRRLPGRYGPDVVLRYGDHPDAGPRDYGSGDHPDLPEHPALPEPQCPRQPQGGLRGEVPLHRLGRDGPALPGPARGERGRRPGQKLPRLLRDGEVRRLFPLQPPLRPPEKARAGPGLDGHAEAASPRRTGCRAQSPGRSAS